MMERASSKPIQLIIYDDPQLRHLAYESNQELKRTREAAAAAEAERERDRPERLKAFWKRLGYTPDRARDEREATRRRLLAMPPAEAWMFEHPEDFNLDTAPTEGAMLRLIRVERMRLKACRLRLRGIGIK